MKDDDKTNQTSLLGRDESLWDVCIDPHLEIRVCLEVLKVWGTNEVHQWRQIWFPHRNFGLSRCYHLSCSRTHLMGLWATWPMERPMAGGGMRTSLRSLTNHSGALWLCEAVYFLCTSCSSDALGIPGSGAFRMASQAVFCFQAQKDETRVKSC